MRAGAALGAIAAGRSSRVGRGHPAGRQPRTRAPQARRVNEHGDCEWPAPVIITSRTGPHTSVPARGTGWVVGSGSDGAAIPPVESPPGAAGNDHEAESGVAGKASVAYPTDPGLLVRAITLLTMLVALIHTAGGATRPRPRPAGADDPGAPLAAPGGPWSLGHGKGEVRADGGDVEISLVALDAVLAVQLERGQADRQARPRSTAAPGGSRTSWRSHLLYVCNASLLGATSTVDAMSNPRCRVKYPTTCPTRCSSGK